MTLLLALSVVAALVWSTNGGAIKRWLRRSQPLRLVPRPIGKQVRSHVAKRRAVDGAIERAKQARERQLAREKRDAFHNAREGVVTGPLSSNHNVPGRAQHEDTAPATSGGDAGWTPASDPTHLGDE